MKAITVEVRLLAVRHYIATKNWKPTCSVFSISRASSYRFVGLYLKGAPLQPLAKFTYPTKFIQAHREYLCKVVLTRRFLTVAAMIRSFNRKFGLSISARTVRRILKQSHIVYRTLNVKSKPRRRKRTFHQRINGSLQTGC